MRSKKLSRLAFQRLIVVAIAAVIFGPILITDSRAMDPPAEISPLAAYKKLPKKKKEKLFSSLKLKNGIVKEGDNIHSSSRESVIWENFPSATCVSCSWREDKGYSLSKTSHELKKSGLTNATAGAAYLGVGFDIEYESKSAMLNCAREIEVYLLTTNTVATIELSVPKEHVHASTYFEEKIKKILSGNVDIASYRDLIEIL